MAKRGGYMRDVPGIEWAKLGAGADAEGKLSAFTMGQDYYTWLNDAVAFHVYYCERYQLNLQYQRDLADAHANNGISPQIHEAKYQVTRERPVVTPARESADVSKTRRQPRP